MVDSEGKEGKHDARFVIPGKEHVLCWDCNYYGHRRGHKVCPNYIPSRHGNLNKGKGDKNAQQVNVTAGGTGEHNGLDDSSNTAPASTLANTEVSSLTSRAQGTSKSLNTVA